MPVDDRTRLNLHRKLDTVLGSDDADTLMAHLPPVTWNEVATKGDIAAAEIATKVQLDALGATLRSEMDVLGATLRSEMGTMRSDLRVEIGSLRTEMATLRTDMVGAANRQIKWIVGFAAVWSSLLVTVVRAIP
jgi:hypothetical protein